MDALQLPVRASCYVFPHFMNKEISTLRDQGAQSTSSLGVLQLGFEPPLPGAGARTVPPASPRDCAQHWRARRDAHTGCVRST